MSKISLSSHLSGPKWAGITTLLHTIADQTNCYISDVDRDKHIIRETVYFTVNGEEKDVRRFVYILESSVETYNL